MSNSKLSVFWTVIWFIVFFPVGIYRMYKLKQFNKKSRMIITISLILSNLAALLLSKDAIIKKKLMIVNELQEDE